MNKHIIYIYTYHAVACDLLLPSSYYLLWGLLPQNGSPYTSYLRRTAPAAPSLRCEVSETKQLILPVEIAIWALCKSTESTKLMC